MAGFFPLPLVVVTKLSSGQRVGRRGELGGDTGVGGTYPVVQPLSCNKVDSFCYAELDFFLHTTL